MFKECKKNLAQNVVIFFPLYLKTDPIQRLSRLASGHACYDAKMQRFCKE